MSGIHKATNDELTQTLAARIRELWDAYQRLDEPAHSAILTGDYFSIHSDGTLHPRATAEEIAAGGMGNYSLTELRAVPLGPETSLANCTTALVNYQAAVEGKVGAPPVRMKFVVGEIWQKREGQWKCRYFQATLQK
jgi:hypothetical protein